MRKRSNELTQVAVVGFSAGIAVGLVLGVGLTLVLNQTPPTVTVVAAQPATGSSSDPLGPSGANGVVAPRYEAAEPAPLVQVDDSPSESPVPASFNFSSSSGARSEQATAAISETVYVTNTGDKYHRAGCQYRRRSSIAIDLDSAIASYSPCSRCHPPTEVEHAALGSTSPSSYSVMPSSQRTSSSPTSSYTPSAGAASGETTATGLPIYVGPRGGRYHYSKNGNKVYERRR